MRRAVASFALIALLAGCTQVHPANPASPGVQTEEISRELAGRKVTVKLRDGSEFPAESVIVTRDSTTMMVLSPSSRDTVLPNSEILTLSFRSRHVSSVVGALVGLVAGVLVGRDNPIGYDPEYHGWFAVTRSDAARWTAILGGIVGFVVGGVAGGAIGVNEVFDFSESPAPH